MKILEKVNNFFEKDEKALLCAAGLMDCFGTLEVPNKAIFRITRGSEVINTVVVDIGNMETGNIGNNPYFIFYLNDGIKLNNYEQSRILYLSFHRVRCSEGSCYAWHYH